VFVNPRLDRLADERGQSLVLALLVLTVLAIVLGSVIFFTGSNQRNSAYQKASQVARSLAEAGVNNGVSALTNAAQAGSTNLLSSTLLPTQTNQYPGGSVQWWGTFDGSEQSTSCPPPPSGNIVYACVGTWTLHGTATVTNPTGPTASAIQRTVTAKMQVYRQQTSNPADVWNWVFSPYNSGLPLPHCDTSFGNSLTLNVRVWVGGNLCAPNNSVFQKSLYVGGSLSLGSPASVGTQSTPIASPEEVYVGGGCQYSSKPFYNPCVKDGTVVSGKAAQTNIFTNTLYTQNGTPIPPYNPLPAADTVFPNVAPPPLCWAQPGDCPTGSLAGGWYSVASPGPLHPCDTASTTPAGNPLPRFDSLNNTSFDDSINGVFNLTPDAYSYTCKTAGGELSWNNAARVLTVQGVIFIDGNATAYTSGNTPVTYKGWGGTPSGACNTPGSCQSVLFLSGTFSIARENLCAVVNAAGTACDQSAWDPNKKLLIIATHNQGATQGGSLSANNGVEITSNQSTFQGGLYAKYAISIQSGGTVQGPLVSGTQTISDGQSGLLSFPTLTISPFAINSPPAFMLCIPSQPCHPFDYTG
jgi:Tfp pilus assembly protein PilX